MQGDEKTLAQAVAKVLVDLREKKGKSLNLFCNEYAIPTSTLSDAERAEVNITISSLYRILKAHDINGEEFFRLIEKELPENFMMPEI